MNEHKLTDEEIKAFNDEKAKRIWFSCHYHRKESPNDRSVHDLVQYPTQKDLEAHERTVHLGYSK